MKSVKTRAVRTLRFESSIVKAARRARYHTVDPPVPIGKRRDADDANSCHSTYPGSGSHQIFLGAFAMSCQTEKTELAAMSSYHKA